jgi:hypothetical protein
MEENFRSALKELFRIPFGHTASSSPGVLAAEDAFTLVSKKTINHAMILNFSGSGFSGLREET